MTLSRRSDLLALALLGTLATLLFLDVLTGINSFYVRDVAQYYHPAKKVLREIVLGGEFPYWNPYFSAGQPMAANPEHEVFYPPTWLIVLPDFELGFRLLVLLHVYLALFAMYALLRSMQLGPPAAFFGALSFGLGGLLLSTLNLLPILFSVAWLPLTCLYARRFLHEPAPRPFALAALFLGLQLLVGEPTTIVQTGLLLGLYALFAGLRRKGVRGAARAVAMIGILVLAAVLLAAVQVLPTLDHVAGSVRSRGLEFPVAAHWSMPPLRIGELVYPHLFGGVRDDEGETYWGADAYRPAGMPFFYSIYCGLLASALAAGGILARRRGTWLVLALVALSIVLALGSHTPLLRLLYDAGIARSTRYPEKFIFFGVFALIVFGARMLDALLRGDERLRKTTLAFIATITVLAALAALYGGSFEALWSQPPTDAILGAWGRGWHVAVARGLLLLLLIGSLHRVRRPVWLALLGLFVIVDLGSVVPQLAPRVPAPYFTEAPAAVRQFPAERDQFRIFHRASWTMGQNLYFRPHPDRRWIVRNGLFPMTPAGHGLRTVMEVDFDLTWLLPTDDFARSMTEIAAARPNAWQEIAASMSNVWYRGLYRPPAEALRRAGGVPRAIEPVEFVPNERYLRYYLADQIVTIRDREDFVRKLSRAPHSKRVAFIRAQAFPPAPGTVRTWRESANSARIEVETTGRALLVMSVTPHKYWRITIDGREVPATVVNIGYQGVVVPGGRHVVEMRYRNPLILWGGVVSVVALAALALCAARGRSSA